MTNQRAEALADQVGELWAKIDSLRAEIEREYVPRSFSTSQQEALVRAEAEVERLQERLAHVQPLRFASEECAERLEERNAEIERLRAVVGAAKELSWHGPPAKTSKLLAALAALEKEEE